MTKDRAVRERGRAIRPRWAWAVAATGTTAAGILAAHSPAWAVGLGTAAAVFAAVGVLLRR